jgi:photosystem II stability/assembly factor-like uncharacterized protein
MKKLFCLYIFIIFILCNVKPSLAQWSKTNGPDSNRVQALAVIGKNLFAGTDGDGVYLSTDNGLNWTPINSGLTNYWVNNLAVNDTNLFAGTMGGGIFILPQNEEIWTEVNFGLTDPDVYCLAIIDTNIFAGTCGGGIFRSVNNGDNWTAINSGFTYDNFRCIQCITPLGSNIYVGAFDGIFVSSNNGDNWINIDTTNTMVYSFAQSGSNLIAGSWGGTFLSDNNGETWTPVNSGPSHILSLAVNDTNVYAGSSGMGVLISSDHGESWYAVNLGLTSTNILCLAVVDTFLYAGTEGNGIWRRPLSDINAVTEPAALEPASIGLPVQFRLGQNYPNPFNPTTMISFDLPAKSYVSLKVFDISGREISNLISEDLPAGRHSRQWNAADYASGIYIYRLQAGKYMETKKLILLK